MDGKMDYGTPPHQANGHAVGGGPDAAAQFYTSKYIRDLDDIRCREFWVGHTNGWRCRL